MQTWLVGGAVRDELLGLEPSERDWVVVGATPGELEAAGYRQVGRDFPVFLHPRTGEEYALARTERKSGHGYHGFTVHAGPDVTLEEDLGRRDLTINAMARDADGHLIDPWGGQADLEARLLRHVSPAFTEDPLRVLRVARFAARFARLGFEVAPETRELMRSMSASGELDWLVPERVWQETARALADPAPRRYFEVLMDCDALVRVLPELAPLFALDADPIPAKALEHATDATPDASIRLASLCFPLAPQGALAELGERLPVPRRWQELALATSEWHMNCLEVPADPEAIHAILAGLDALRRPDRFAAVLTACDAIAAARDDRDAWGRRRGLLERALGEVQTLSGQTLAAEGWRGEALGQELERRRRAAIARLVGMDGG
jgi:tRNA nucleotidyltransferase (CCA-adding enzyme)